MIEPNTLKELESYNNPSFPILTVYLGADNLQAPSRELLLTQFHSLLHKNISSDQRVTFEKDIERIEEYLNSYIPSARSLVFFSAGENLWRVASLEFSLPINISVGSSPNITPIIQSQQKYSRFLVLLVDREKARMFTVEQGEILDHSDVIGGYVPQYKKATGRDGNAGRGDIMNRHTDMLLRQHIDLIIQAVDKFVKASDISFLIIGGHAEMFKKVAAALPTDLRAKLAGSFVSELNIPINDILLESKKIAAIV